MRARVVRWGTILGAYLVLAIGVPIAVVELVPHHGWFGASDRDAPPDGVTPVARTGPPNPQVGPSNPPDGSDPRPSPSEKGPLEVEAPSPRSKERVTATVRTPTWLVHGILTLSSQMPASGRELQLETARGLRPVWSDDDGAFSFVLTGPDFPVRLTSEGKVAYELESPPPDERVFVNVHLIQVSQPERRLVLPHSVSAQRGSDSIRIRCHGATRIPAGNRLILRLLGGGDKILEGSLFTIGEPDFLGELNLPGTAYFSGYYKAVFEWKPHSARAEDLNLLREYLPSEIPGVVVRPYRFYMGRKREEAEQALQIREFYSAAVEECLASRDILHLTGATVRGEEIELSARQIERLRRHPSHGSAAALVAPGGFDFARWRRMIDKELPGRWREIVDLSKVPFPEKHPRLKQNLALLLQTLHRFARLESRLVYRARQRKPHKNDYVDIELGVETDHDLTDRRLRKFARDLLRRIR